MFWGIFPFFVETQRISKKQIIAFHVPGIESFQNCKTAGIIHI
jgi:hypothetical protein